MRALGSGTLSLGTQQGLVPHPVWRHPVRQRREGGISDCLPSASGLHSTGAGGKELKKPFFIHCLGGWHRKSTSRFLRGRMARRPQARALGYGGGSPSSLPLRKERAGQVPSVARDFLKLEGLDQPGTGVLLGSDAEDKAPPDKRPE